MYRRLLQKVEYKHKIFELNYQIAIRCFKSKYLERRIQGLKSIIDCSRSVRFNNLKYFFSSQEFANWLNDEKVLDLLFDRKKTHMELIKRATDLIKFYVYEDILNEGHLQLLFELLWSEKIGKSQQDSSENLISSETTQCDDEMKKAIYKIIEDVSLGLTYEHMIITINKIKQIDATLIANEEIDVLYELSR